MAALIARWQKRAAKTRSTAGRNARVLGSNAAGALGNGESTTIPSPSPLDVSGLADMVDVAAGLWFTCAARGDGAVFCWGINDEGQAGDPSRISHPSPFQLTL
jgi:alpha-tubulin suppressor-like RCC1 family protein